MKQKVSLTRFLLVFSFVFTFLPFINARAGEIDNSLNGYKSLSLISSTGEIDEIQNPQKNTVSGVVTNMFNEKLVGVAVLVKETGQGTVSDFDGNYKIEIESNQTLVFSSVGYISKEVRYTGQKTISISMEDDVTHLDDVVVVGYGTQKRSDLTGAISTIKPGEIADFPIARADEALQGKAAGVFVLATDSSPGGNMMIRIRGSNSINGGNEPLIVVDGLQGANINSLNPADIESMEVLKDASATAIYGSNGANGVIIITTKRGREGKPIIEVGVSTGIQQLARKLPVMSAGDYATVYNQIRATETYDGNIPVPIFTDEEIEGYYRNGGTDWQDVVYETGVITNAQIGVNGKTENMNYYVSGNVLDHKGILVGSEYKRYSLRTNFNATITDWLDFGFGWNYTLENAVSASFGEGGVAFTSQVINNAVRWGPTEPVFDADGSYHRHGPYGANDTWNPLASAIEPEHDNPVSNNNATMSFIFKLVDGLTLTINGSGSRTNTNERTYYNRFTNSGFSNDGQALIYDAIYQRLQNSNILTYDNTWDKHHLTLTGLLEQQTSEFNSNSTNASSFLVDQLGFNNLQGAKNVLVSSFANERSLLSYMGRVNYNFDDRFLITASFRADASSVFGEDNKWGYFPSASVAWNISNEKFMNNDSNSWNLKLRASWGETGNQGIRPYQSLANLSSSYLYPYQGNETADIGFGLGRIANPNLKWEVTEQINFGLDLGLFRGRLRSSIDVYRKETSDLLMPRDLPGYTGISSIMDNVGSVENKGIEFQLSGDPIVGDFNWNTSFNLTANRNEVLDLGGTERITYTTTQGGYDLNDFMILEVGQPFGTMRGYVFEGIWSTDEEAEARSYGQLPGMEKFKDINQDGIVDVEDQTVIGNGYPDFIMGWTNNLSYKNWNLNFMFISYQGVDLFNQLRIRREGPGDGNSPRMLDAWTPDNQDTDIPGYLDAATVEGESLENLYFLEGNESSRWVEDASFIRLKTVNLSYSFNDQWLKNLGMQNFKIYVAGTNLWTYTDYTGYDPEVAAFSANDAQIGVDFSNYPPAKTYTLGLELSF